MFSMRAARLACLFSNLHFAEILFHGSNDTRDQYSKVLTRKISWIRPPSQGQASDVFTFNDTSLLSRLDIGKIAKKARTKNSVKKESNIPNYNKAFTYSSSIPVV